MERNEASTGPGGAEKPRLVYLDFLRCLAILLVVVLHVMTPYVSDTALYGTRTWYVCILQNEWNRTGVPLFFMISGYLLLRDPRTERTADFYRTRLPRLLIPLAVWDLIYCVVNAWRAGEPFRAGDYVSSLLNNGAEYHFWFVYTLLGLYLLTPFLKRIVDHVSKRELLFLLALVLFPGAIRPLLNRALPVYIFLFDPLMEGYAGFFLLGYLLGRFELPRRARAAVYLGGAAGYALGTVGNLATASAEGIPLPFNLGYSLNHYLCAAALFLLAKTLFERHAAGAARWERPLAALSGAAFGVYWVHVLALKLSDLLLSGLAPSLGPGALIFGETVLTVAISFVVALPMSRVPVVRRLFS